MYFYKNYAFLLEIFFSSLQKTTKKEARVTYITHHPEVIVAKFLVLFTRVCVCAFAKSKLY